MDAKILYVGIISMSIAPLFLFGGEKKEAEKKNVLFIAFDDLRPELKCFGNSDIISPNIDKLAAAGVAFNRTYCNIAVSGASRASILTGTRPTRNTFLNAETNASVDKSDKIAINDYFQSQGYRTEVRGKIFHHSTDHKKGWDEFHTNEYGNSHYLSEANNTPRTDGRRPMPYECVDVADDKYADGIRTLDALKDLERLSKSEQPFFYAFGFSKPHLPFNAPKRYWDMYEGKIELPDNFQLKQGHNIPERAMSKWGELRNYAEVPSKGQVDRQMAINLIQGYRACVSYVDAQLGLLIDKLRELRLDQNTIIVLWGDHGWNLGEHGLWSKHTILETSLHAPLIVCDPSSKLKGYVSEQVVEFVDIFPTVCDATGIEKPKQLEGESLYPLLNDKNAKSKGYALCRWMQGYTLVTDDKCFYTEWWDKNDNVEERLLFDHNVDPDENYNVVNNPKYEKRVSQMSVMLKEKRGTEFDKY